MKSIAALAQRRTRNRTSGQVLIVAPSRGLGGLLVDRFIQSEADGLPRSELSGRRVDGFVPDSGAGDERAVRRCQVRQPRQAETEHYLRLALTGCSGVGKRDPLGIRSEGALGAVDLLFASHQVHFGARGNRLVCHQGRVIAKQLRRSGSAFVAETVEGVAVDGGVEVHVAERISNRGA